jgi:cell division protein FtsI/penicillin-binding protein 2
MLGTIFRTIIALAAIAAVMTGAGVRLGNLFANANTPQRTVRLTEDRELFDSLVKYGVIRPRPDTGLDVLPSDYFLVREAQGKDRHLNEQQRVRYKEQRRLHGILYFAQIGTLIREQVRLWNETRYIAAIRDNRTRPPGDYHNEWAAISPKGHPIRLGRLVPESFGFVLDGELTPGFSDWAAVSREHGSVTFTTTINARQSTVMTVQVVGTPVAVTPKSASIKKLETKPEFGCGARTGAIVRVPIRASSKPVAVSITVDPSVNCEHRISGLAIRMAKDAVGKYTTFDWRPIKRARSTPSRFVLTTRDGVALTTADGKPTPDAYQLGLVPLIGFGPAATFSLSGIMAGANLPPQGVTAALTIDSKLQKAAQAAVLAQIARERGVRDADKRKAAVVVLDAHTGAILAVASYPTVPVGARPWDYAAFGNAFPLRDPSTVIAWGIIDRNNSPGSTFKPVVALSVMHSAKGAELAKFRRIMEGLGPGEIASVMGLSPGQSSYAPMGLEKRAISNFGGGGLGPFHSTGRNPLCDPHPPVYDTFGLRQAVQYSVNVYFARLSNMLDEQRVKSIVDELVKEKRRGLMIQRKPSRLIESARWLGINDLKRMDLATNLPPYVKLRRFNSAAGADVLYPQVAKQAFTNAEIYPVPGAVQTLMHISALNGIGQSVSVHPLHMARIAATVASGTRVMPYIFTAWDGQRLKPPPPKPLNIDLSLLNVLRQGMKAVPEKGTAAGRFPGKLMCRTYGKTGTAEIVKKTGQHSGWFIGWREPPDGSPPVTPSSPANDRKLAFACMITHGYGGFRTGGSSCAPIVSQILQTIEKDAKTGTGKKKRGPRRASRSN